MQQRPCLAFTGQVSSFGHELPQQSDGVLVAAALPGELATAGTKHNSARQGEQRIQWTFL
jgi:hypothetical protein